MWPNLCQPANVRVPVLTCGLYLMYSVFSAVLYVIFYAMTCPPAYMGFNQNQVVGSQHHLGTIDQVKYLQSLTVCFPPHTNSNKLCLIVDNNYGTEITLIMTMSIQ